MDNYYSQQASMPYFSGHYRQRGSGFGALAAGIGRVALPIARKFIWPAAKKIGRELISQAAPELVDVVTKKKSAKQALKNTVRNTARRQLGGGRRRRQQKRRITTRRVNRRRPLKKRKLTRRTISQKRRPRRRRSDFFSNVQNAK